MDIWNLDNTRRVLYRLPDLIETVSHGGTVYITEGEKDADAINALNSGPVTFLHRNMQSRRGGEMAGSWMNPDLTLGVMNLPTSLDFHEEAMTSVDFGFMFRIPFPGKLKSAGEAQKAKTLAAQSDYEQAKLNMVAMVKMAYYELAGLNAVKSSLTEGTRLADDLIQAAQAMTASGLGNQADILRAQLEKDRWQQRCIHNEQDIAHAHSRLARYRTHRHRTRS